MRRRDPAANPVVAHACVLPAGLADGACPPGTFPPPKLPDGMTIGLASEDFLMLPLQAFGVNATWTEVPKPDREYRVTLRCEDGTDGESTLNTELSAAPLGVTVSDPEVIWAHPPPTEAPGRCELRFTSTPTKSKAETVHGIYCLHQTDEENRTGKAKPGACTPTIVPRERPEEASDRAEGDYRMQKK